MLNHLFHNLPSWQTKESAPVRFAVVPGTDKLERRQRQIEREYRLPKSVCTSLRDICEM